MKKFVSVSEISSYAADPVKYCNARGQAYNSAAARKGNQSHERAGAGRLNSRIIVMLALVAAVLLYAVEHRGFHVF